MSRSYIPKALRERVAEQARHRCGYCLTSERIVGIPAESQPAVVGGSATSMGRGGMASAS